MQAVNLSADDFSKRTDKLAMKLGISLREMCRRADISQPMFFGYRSGKNEVSAKALRKIEALEMVNTDQPQAPPPRMQLNPAYATPPAGPTRAQIEARVRAYLDAAEQVPGGLGFAWGQVATHLNPATLEALKMED